MLKIGRSIIEGFEFKVITFIAHVAEKGGNFC